MSTEKGPNNEKHMALLTVTEGDHAGTPLSINIALLTEGDHAGTSLSINIALLTGVCRKKIMDTKRRLSKLSAWEKDFEHTT